MKKVIHSDQAPQAIGPYSQAIKANGMLFVSGQIPLDPVTGQIVYGGAGMQTRQAIRNLQAILEREGLSLSDVVKATVFLQNMNDFSEVNTVYGEYFANEPPARSAVQVGRLPRDVSVEIEVIAVYPQN